jgi:putative ABC transport system permease protein
MNQIAALPGVAGVSAARRQIVESSVGSIELLAVTLPDHGRSPYRIKSGAAAWPRFLKEDVLLISEPFAARHGLGAGDRLRLVTPAGPVDFEIAGVFFDYRSDRGIAMMSRRLFAQYWQLEDVTSIGVVLDAGSPPDQVKGRLQTIFGHARDLSIRSNREIREASLAMFDRTFAITELLRMLAVGVALAGLVSSLLALQLERVREYGILRALGLTPAQLVGVIMAQSGFIGLCAGVLALPVGALVAWVLVAVVQYQSFGWSMDLRFPFNSLWQTPLMALVAAWLGGLFPAWKAARLTPMETIREE